MPFDPKIAALQQLLHEHGFDPGKIDGRDGDKTAKALSALQVARGGCARRINRIVLHCTATREGQFVDAAEIRRWHKAQGWADIGYHYVICLNGKIEPGRPDAAVGSHALGFNSDSIGIVYVGGLAADGKTPKDTRTSEQHVSLAVEVKLLALRYPGAVICGHRDLSPDANRNGRIEPFEWTKACPSFDVASWLKEIGL